MAERTPIDFVALAGALLDRAETLVPEWLPGGKRSGHEWVCGSLSGGEGGSFSVNLVNGRWAEFSGDDSGGDLISLYAAIHGLNQGMAARQLMDVLGWRVEDRPYQAPARREPSAAEGRGPEPPPDDDRGEAPNGSSGGRRKSLWQPIVPVPPEAGPCSFVHWHYSPADLVKTWEYRIDGELYGYVARFAKSDGGKEILPYTYCVDESDDRGTRRWHTKQWDEPRPLYLPAGRLSLSGALPVVIVEGEKCALAGQELLGDEFDFVSWPGGGKAWSKADWTRLRGLAVYLWPDCDAKRHPLNAEEREANVDPKSKALKPEARQPGMQTMVGIGSLLAGKYECTVHLCPIPKPGDVDDGWDLADAIEQSRWSVDEVRSFIRGARLFVPPDDSVRASVAIRMSTAEVIAPDAWRSGLEHTVTGSVKASRENAVLALDGRRIKDRRVPGIAEVAGVVGFNEFTNNVEKRAPAPWDSPAGVWDEVDELHMGEWLVREHGLPGMSRAVLEESVLMVAKRHRFHPVRDAMLALRGKWDRQPRLRTWLRLCCLEEDQWDDEAPLQRYLARVGTWLVMAMVARVLTPGCKFDNMVIFEGPQGAGKSTLASILGGAYYADTGLMLGDKDSYQNLQGISIYEMGELDALNKSDITKIKLFISSQKDRFRASFDKRPKDYPRQVVFIGTTNEDHYLSDPTGNRRMWPVKVTRKIDLEWLRANREQLFAEALMMVERGDRFHPTDREQRQLFEPQQQQRVVENAIESAIASYVNDDLNGSVLAEVTLIGVLAKIGIQVEKLGPGRFHEKQAASALRRLGWLEVRSAAPGRPRVYRRPKPEAREGGSFDPVNDAPTQGHSSAGDPDGIPF